MPASSPNPSPPSRREVMGGLAGLAAAGLHAPASAAAPAAKPSPAKKLLVFYLNGGLSQFESFDPKPGGRTGGPFRAISTSVPGVQISELLPHTAKQVHRMSIVRSVYSKGVPGSHDGARYYVETGRSPALGRHYPVLGAIAARMLPTKEGLPPYVQLKARGEQANDAGFLGARYASLVVSGGKPPANLSRPEAISDAADQRRHLLRLKADERFTEQRGTTESEAHQLAFEQARQLMRRQDIFDLGREPARDRDRYGDHDFGRDCLLARRLLEQGVTCVKVYHNNYDTHRENFNFHMELLEEFDGPFATLLEDLDDRGLLKETLVVLQTDFGRTPFIQSDLGRDHWPPSWSVVMAGCKTPRGAVIGKTNALGTEVADRPVHVPDLYHTYIAALGLNPDATYDGTQFPLGAPGSRVVDELLG